MITALTQEISKANQKLGDQVIDYLFRTLAIGTVWSVRDQTCFTWWPYRFPQRVWFEPLWVEDGSAYIRIHAETLVFRDVPDNRATASRLDALNQLPAMNGFIWNRQTRRISVHFCAYVTDETFGWLKTFLAAAMGLQIVGAHATATAAQAQ